MYPCLTLSIISYGSRVKWSNPGKGVAPSPTHWCCSYRKESLRVTLDYGRQLYLFIYIYIYIYNSKYYTELLLYSHNQLYIHICMQKHNDAMKTSGHSSLEKYTSHFIWKGSNGLLKVLLCERWVGDWTELQHIDPHSYGHNSVSFPFSWAAQPGAWGPSLSGTWSSFQHLLSNSSKLPVAGYI